MDIETVDIDNKKTPYLICGFNGIDKIVSYNYNQTELFNNFINSLLTFFKNNNKLTVYAHNLSSFDGIFLLKHLLPMGSVDPLLFNGKLISIKVKLNIKGYKNKTIIFKDSMLLLPTSLRNLCKTFKVTNVKGVFPFLLNDINYFGEFPKFEYFKDLELSKYLELNKEFSNKSWNFKNEAIKYCNLDCVSLYEVLTKFNQLMFSEFNINIHECLTAPSLSMRIFKSIYMKNDSIYQLHGGVEQNIRCSYTGGATDVYIPHNRVSTSLLSTQNNLLQFDNSLSHFLTYDYINTEYETLYYYDVNGLYPTTMLNELMPVGKPIPFDGNILKIEPDAFGLFNCEITSPDYLEHPIIQQKVKTSQGSRTIAALGTWNGWIFSEEMYNAMKFGYIFKINKGYLFDKGNLFKDYIQKLFNLRLKYPKGTPMNEIAKLLQNSLYGKFGMKDEITKLDIFNYQTSEDQESVNELLDLWKGDIIDMIEVNTPIGKRILILRNTNTVKDYNEDLDLYHGSEVNVAIASAITSYARVHMSQFKNNPDFKLYYSDTDSIVINKPLPDNMIGSALGQVKLEHIINRAVFLAPKVYGFITEDGQEILKVKGLTKEVINKLTFNDLESLLIQDSSQEFTQEKWNKSVINGTITTSNQLYTLKTTNSKRNAIYENGLFTNTKPYNYDEIHKK